MKSPTSTVTSSLLILIQVSMCRWLWLSTFIFDKVQLVDLQLAREGYCLPCVLFARSIDVWNGKGVLVETAFTYFKKMYEVCDLHAAREHHKDAIVVCDAFIERMSGK